MFACGGTAGHINPAISVADYAKSKDENFEALFIGTKKGLETNLVPNAGYDIEYIDVQGFNRSKLLSNVKTVYKLFESVSKCKKETKAREADVSTRLSALFAKGKKPER